MVIALFRYILCFNFRNKKEFKFNKYLSYGYKYMNNIYYY